MQQNTDQPVVQDEAIAKGDPLMALIAQAFKDSLARTAAEPVPAALLALLAECPVPCQESAAPLPCSLRSP